MREFARKKRNKPKGKPRPVLVLVAEGKNVTEVQYFKWFNSPDCPYYIIFHKAGHTTDPAGLKESVERFWYDEGWSSEEGDLCYVVVDLDCDSGKAGLIKKLQCDLGIAKFIVSNPCFEIWFLLHFQYTTHAFKDGNDVIRELSRTYIQDYTKDMDAFPMLKKAINTAIQNSKKLIAHFDEDQYPWPDVRRNPQTDVWKVIELLTNTNNNGDRAFVP